MQNFGILQQLLLENEEGAQKEIEKEKDDKITPLIAATLMAPLAHALRRSDNNKQIQRITWDLPSQNSCKPINQHKGQTK